MVGAIAPSDNPIVTFNTFVLDAVRRTPIEDDWQRQVCCNTFGLVAETTQFMRLCRRWTMGEALPARYLLVRQLGPLESYRALICYQLHLSPVEVPMPGLVECSLESAVSELVLQAGHLAGVMRVWVSSGKWLDRLAVRDMQRFDLARMTVFSLLGISPQEVWQTYDSGSPEIDMAKAPVPPRLIADLQVSGDIVGVK